MVPEEVVIPRPAPRVPFGPGATRFPYHVTRSAAHGVSSHNVLIQSSLQETVRRNDANSPVLYVSLRHYTSDSTVMIDVAVRVYNGHHRLLGSVLVEELQASLGCFRGNERIDHNHTRIPFDEGDVREISASDLVNAVRNLEQARVHEELSLSPQAGINGIRSL